MPNILRFLPLLAFLLPSIGCASGAPLLPQDQVFELSFEVSVPKESVSETTTIWVPVPLEDGVQRVASLAAPEGSTVSTADSYGNRFSSLTPVREGTYVWVWRVERSMDEPGRLDAEPTHHYLSPNRLVPVGGEAAHRAIRVAETAGDRNLMRALYDQVLEDMDYAKIGDGWGTGSTEWACAEGYGNCTDFHALFISMSRSLDIPARFTIGFPLGSNDEGTVSGYHCWAHYWDSSIGWTPVDISEADKHPDQKEFFFGNLDASRISMTAGRDLILDPPQAGAPLNYMVRAYAEKDNQEVSVDTTVRFRRLP
ncbi:MAG: transglutaminase domain-containing protein [Planctomycetota bacterium]|nr:transglutaminase domain-containing protein [Planctomycetota bacterium]MDP6941039.1 transglutaminase domain-containing protein [Planctomycetota bacterium]